MMNIAEHADRYNQMMAEVQKIQDAFINLNRLASTFTESPPMSMFKDLSRRVNLLPPQQSILVESLDESRRILTTASWIEFIKSNKLNILMNESQFTAFYGQAKVSPLKFDNRNLTATATALFRDYSVNVERGLIDVFESLSLTYKSHDSFSFKRKCILKDFIQLHRMSNTCASISPHDSGSIRVKDLYNGVLYLLYPNRPPQEFDIISTLNNHLLENGMKPYEDEIMKFKFCKNGNVHMEFSDLRVINLVNDLLSRYYENAIAAR